MRSKNQADAFWQRGERHHVCRSVEPEEADEGIIKLKYIFHIKIYNPVKIYKMDSCIRQKYAHLHSAGGDENERNMDRGRYVEKR